MMAAADVFEGRDDYLVRVDVPGVSHDNLSVELDRGVLTISSGSDGSRPLRRFQLGRDVDAESISATLEHGVLEISVPKAASARRRRVDIAIA